MNHFYKGKTVLVTGHTGFKGAWLCKILDYLGANIIGFAKEPPTMPNLYQYITGTDMTDVRGDIRSFENTAGVIAQYKPEIIFHLAAQPIVRNSYKDPLYTYETNVLGTVNLLEAVRRGTAVRSFVNITTDKVYKETERNHAYCEEEELDGWEPYSNSKSCSELATNCYRRSFFRDRNIGVSTCRAGNVIGGGDFAEDRIIPDCYRAVSEGKAVPVRNPYSVRPYQHVLEPLVFYLLLAKAQYEDRSRQGNYNVGPDEADCVTTGRLVDLFCGCWGGNAFWLNTAEENADREAEYLKLDNSRIKKQFQWRPVWNIEKAVEKTVLWYQAFKREGPVQALMTEQIQEYLEESCYGGVL